MTQPDWDSLKGRLEANGQGHVLNWLDELSESEKGILYQDLSEIDLDNLQRQASNTFAIASKRVVPFCNGHLRTGGLVLKYICIMIEVTFIGR